MQIQEKGFLAKLLEKGIKILIKKECKDIRRLRIDISATSKEIIKGRIRKIKIIAEDINYKDLIFDEIELEANKVKLIFKLNQKELRLNNNIILNFKISLSENSLKSILLSDNWNWIGDMITNEILNENRLEYITIKNNQILIKDLNESRTTNKEENLCIKTEKGKLYLENKNFNKSIKIPIEDKVCFKKVIIKDNKIIIFAKSPVDF